MLSGVACFSHPRGLIYAPPCQEIYHLPTFVAHVLFHSIYILGLNINMRITATTVALLLHHAATAHKASKAPAKGSKSKKGKTGKGTAAPTGALCTSANSFNNTSLRKAVADYFSQGCPTEPNCETILQYGVIGGWKTCEVTDMDSLFDEGINSQAANFNESLNNWDVSKVTTMAGMFYGAASYNQPLNDWDVSKVTTMNGMFSGAAAYNQPLNDWDVSKVTNMRYMFYYAAAYNQPLDDWDVSNVADMNSMFGGAAAYNQPMNYWDVSNVTDMGYMFKNAAAYNQPMTDWDVSKVTSMGDMFKNAAAFNQNLCDWGTKLQATGVNNMFEGSGCTNKGAPDLSLVPPGPFCADCSVVFV